ncbi:MAG: hydrogenase expression/formation protein HypE [Methanobacteriota archaeon]|jgi:hydrogenase expression/formation protein HypE
MEITLAHGAGGELMNQLISQVIIAHIKNRSAGGVGLDELDDGASIPIGDKEIVISTDAHTIKPIFFPGGDIGKLAVCGTINDVAMMGAMPLAIASAIVVEEGFLSEELEKIIRSMDEVASAENIAIITGDTKVMEKGALDKIVITTTGIGIAERGRIIKDSGLSDGDKIILTGSIGDHGIALMSFREGFGFETTLQSDIAPLWSMVEKILAVGGITAMKDPTRGGLAAALNEWARKSNFGIIVREDKIPLKREVLAASEMLGIDPFTVANEGKAIIGVKPEKAEKILQLIKSMKLGKDAQIIGEVTDRYNGKVILETVIGGRRIMQPPIGDPVPRVC